MPRQKFPWELKRYEEMNKFERLAALLFEEREKRGWSRDTLGEALGVSSTAIMHWEQKNNFIGSEALYRLAAFRGESFDSLVSWLNGNTPQVSGPPGIGIRALADKMTGSELLSILAELQELAVKKIRMEDLREFKAQLFAEKVEIKKAVEQEKLLLREKFEQDKLFLRQKVEQEYTNLCINLWDQAKPS